MAGAALDVRIECERVGHRYAAGRGLDPVSFSLTGPGLAAVTGPNGSGKSTLLRVLAGLLRPAAGRSELSVSGRGYPAPERRHVTGWCSPELQFYAELTVRENLRFAAEARGLDDPDACVMASVEAIGLTGRLDDRAAALSSGLRQRLRLAFAILGDPPVLLLDEPGSHLDEPGRARLAGLLARRRETARVLMATNDSREWSLADERIPLGAHDLGDPS
ncbi:MAG: ABC transporter ATP-binding protein [Candidatus Eisenbacteria bacterium]